MNCCPRMRVTLMPDRKNKVRIGFPDPTNILKVVSYMIGLKWWPFWFFPKWRPARGATLGARQKSK